MTDRQHDIGRYLRGEMTAAEMHAFEKEALEDPFLSDAIDGAHAIGPENFLFDLHHVKSSITSRSNKRKPRLLSMWNWSIGIAAGLMVVGLSGLYLISQTAKQEQPWAEIENVQPYAHDLAQRDTIEILMPKIRTLLASAEHASENSARLERVTSGERQRRRTDEVEVSLTDPSTIQVERSQSEQQSVATNKPPLSVNPRIIKGVVTSAEDGSVLPGVNVVVKGTTIGTVTDAEGHYEITVTSPDQKLAFNFIGVKPVEAETRNKTQVNVSLVPDYESLSEVVVTGAAVNEADHPTYNLAQPKGGREAYSDYLKKKLVYPEQALMNEVEGRVTIQFTVDTDGQLRNFKVINSLGFGCDDEAIRLIREGPAWLPSKKNDTPVAEEVKVGLKFDIPNKKN